jgi:hypothetical protein
MKKGIVTTRMFNRIKVIDKFVIKNKRLPNNIELGQMFGGKAGQKTINILKFYSQSKKICIACGHKLNI